MRSTDFCLVVVFVHYGVWYNFVMMDVHTVSGWIFG